MRFMLLIYGDEQAWDQTEREQCYVESTQLAHPKAAPTPRVRLARAQDQIALLNAF